MSESWINLSDGEVLPLASQERKTVAQIKGADDLSAICEQVTEQVRQAYLFSNRDLGPEGTIPMGLKERAISIALWQFVSEGVPKVEKLQTKERESAASEARKYLDRIAAADIGRVSAPSVGERCRRFGVRREEGI